MLTPEFENSAYAADYDPDWRKKAMNNKTETIAYFGSSEPLNLEHMKKFRDQLKSDWESSRRKTWDGLLADLRITNNVKDNIWHGITDPPEMGDPYLVSVYIPSLTTTGIQDKTTGVDWKVTSTQTVPKQDKPCDIPEVISTDDLEIRMLEDQIRDMRDAIKFKKERRNRISDLKKQVEELEREMAELG
jgi:hypothetical protein